MIHKQGRGGAGRSVQPGATSAPPSPSARSTRRTTMVPGVVEAVAGNSRRLAAPSARMESRSVVTASASGKRQSRACREHMICPLPRASEMTAPEGGEGELLGWTLKEVPSHGGLSDRRRGAGHEGTGSDPESEGEEDHVDPSRRDSGDYPAEPAALEEEGEAVR